MSMPHRHPHGRAAIGVAAVLGALICLVARGETVTWDGGGADRNWGTASNWAGDVVPAPAADLEVNLPTGVPRYNPIVNLYEPWTLNRLYIGDYQYSISGGTLRFDGDAPRLIVGPGTHGFGFSCPLELAADLTVEMQQSYNFAMNGIVSGSGSFTLVGNCVGTARLGHFYKAATYTGTTAIFGYLSLSSTEGRIAGSSRVDLYPAGKLNVNSGGTGLATNRFNDSIPIVMYGGLLSNANTNEIVDGVTMKGGLGYLVGSAGSLRIGSLTRYNLGSARIRGAGGIFIGDVNGVPAADLLAGGGGGAGTTTISILPCMHSDATFTTYSDVTGFRALSTTTEYVDGILSAGPLDNVVQTNNVTLTSNTTVNALLIPSYNLTISGAYTLRLNSGALLISQNTRNQTIGASYLDFAGREAFITVHNTGGYSTPLTINSVITNAAGLTFAGSFANNHGNTTGSPLYLGGASVYTGRTAVLVGTMRLQSGNNRLPVTTSVTLGYGAQLTIYNVNQTVTGLEGFGNVSISQAGKTLAVDNTDDFVLDGAVSGAGRLLKSGSGMQTINGACTYTDTTTVTGGVLRINGSLSEGGAAVTVYSAGTLGGSGTISRAVNILGGTLAPGSGVGTMTITGDVTFAENSVYEWECDEDGSDLVDVNGVLTLPAVATVVVSQTGAGLPDNRTLFTFNSRAGAAALSNWLVVGLGNYRAEIIGSSVVLLPPRGTVVVVR